MAAETNVKSPIMGDSARSVIDVVLMETPILSDREQEKKDHPKLYTARIYDSLKIRKMMPDAVQICIQRRPYRYVRKAAGVLKYPSLGPPMDLHNDSREFLKHVEKYGWPFEPNALSFQTRYAARYLSYVLIGNDSDGPPEAELNNVRRFLTKLKEDVILECSCDANEFCHRLLLYHLLIHMLGEEYAGGELDLKEMD